MQADELQAKPLALVIDDCQDTLRTLRHFFEAAGAEVITAESGSEALDLYSNKSQQGIKGEFQLIVTDIRMPKMNGTEVVKRLRQAGYAGKIVVLTAAASGEGRCGTIECGADTYLSKLTFNEKIAETLVSQAAIGR